MYIIVCSVRPSLSSMTDELNRPSPLLVFCPDPTPRPSSVHRRAAPQSTRPAPSAASAARKRLSLPRVRWGTTSGMPAGQRIAALFIPRLLNIVITRPHQTCIVRSKSHSTAGVTLLPAQKCMLSATRKLTAQIQK